MRAKEKETTDDEMAGWDHWVIGHEFEQTLGNSEGQGSLACCTPWSHKKSDITEQLNRTAIFWKKEKKDSNVLPISDVFQVLLAQYEPCEVVYFGKVYYASLQRPVQGKILQT